MLKVLQLLLQTASNNSSSSCGFLLCLAIPPGGSTWPALMHQVSRFGGKEGGLGFWTKLKTWPGSTHQVSRSRGGRGV